MHILLLSIGVLIWIKYLTDKEVKITMTKLKITQIKSKIGSTERQKRTLAALGLTKINQTIEHEENAQIKGMVAKVKHLISVEVI